MAYTFHTLEMEDKIHLFSQGSHNPEMEAPQLRRVGNSTEKSGQSWRWSGNICDNGTLSLSLSRSLPFSLSSSLSPPPPLISPHPETFNCC